MCTHRFVQERRRFRGAGAEVAIGFIPQDAYVPDAEAAHCSKVENAQLPG